MLARTRAILDHLPAYRGLVGVELGVHRGENARGLLEARPDLDLYCVDLWLPHPGVYREHYSEADRQAARDDWPGNVREVWRNLWPYRGRVRILAMETAAAAVVPCMVDFVFVDGYHAEPYITRDLYTWLFKLRQGGLLCGHDYDRARFPDVCAAVDRVAADLGVELVRGEDTTWFLSLPTSLATAARYST